MAWGLQKFGWVGRAFDLIARQRGRARRWARRRRVRKSPCRREPVRPISLRSLETLEGRAFFSVGAGATYDVSLVDKSLPQSKLLIRGAAEHTRVITFDSRTESTARVLQRVIDLGEHTRGARIRALSVFSHGTRGRFALGDEWVSDETLDDTAGRWRKLRGVLAVDAAVQLFGCETAAGSEGQVLLGRLSELTGATVFGSTDVTGAGGDWELEAVSRAGVAVGGRVARAGLFSEARVPLNATVQDRYQGTLGWIGATSGATVDAAHDYNNTANWAGGVIDDSFAGVTLTAATTLYLSADHTTGAAGLDLGYGGAFDLTIQSDTTTARTLTLGVGGISGDFGGASNRTVTLGSATNAVNVSMDAASRTFDVAGSDKLVLKNVLSGLALTKTGAGQVSLVGANTYTGGTAVNAGTLSVGDHTPPGTNPSTNTALGSGAVVVDNGATLTLDTQSGGGTIYVVTIANDITLNGNATFKSIEGDNRLTGTLTINGAGNAIQPRTSNKPLRVEGILTGSGSVDVTGISNAFSPGTLRIDGSNGGFTGTIAVNGSTNVGVQLVVGNNSALVNATVLAYGPIPAALAANSVYTQKTSPVVFISGITAPQFGMLGGSGDIALLTNTAGAAVALTVGGNNTSQTYSGVLSGSGSSLTKAGTAALALGGTSTYTGGTTLSAGELDLNNAGAIGTGALTIAAGTTLDNTSGAAVALSGNNAQTWNGNFTFGGTSDLNLGGGGLTIGGDRTITTNGTATLTVGGGVSGAIALTKAGTGKLSLGGANTHSGGTTLSAGTLNLNNASALGTGTFSVTGGTIDNTSGAAITLSTNNAQSWGGNFAFTGTNALNLGTGAVALSANRQITTTGGTLAVGGNIGGAFSLTKAGAGTLRLGGASTYSGGTTVTAGTLEGYNAAGGTAVITPTVFGSTASTVSVAGGATLWLNYLLGANNNTVTYANAFSGAGTLKVTAPGSQAASSAELTGNLSGITGTLDLLPNSGSNGKTALNNPTAGTQPSASAMIKVRSGTTLFLWRGLTYASSVQLFGTGNAEGLGALRVETGATLSGTVTLMGNASVGANSGAGTVTGVISDGGNGYSLTKQGNASTTLTGANTYAGGTTVNAGTLRLNNTAGSAAGTGNVTVANGTTLGGTGAVSGAVSVQSGGTFAPGAPGATAFASGGLTVASGGNYSVDVNSNTPGTGYDRLTVTGAVTLTGSTLNASGTRPVTGGDAIVLIDNDGSDAVVGTFNGLAQGASVSVNGVAYTLSYTGGTGNDVVLTDAAPTVATAASATPSPVTGTTTALSVLGASSAGESTLTYTWAATTKPAGSTPAFSDNGTNAAQNSIVTFDRAGSYTFTVTISNGTDSTTSSVTVAVNQTLTAITVSPASASLNLNGTQQFSAVGYDQFGLAMGTQPAFTWSRPGGVGAIDASTGLYTAPSSDGSAVIQAAAGGVSGTADVTVTDAAPTTATPAAATPSPVTGTSTTLTALGSDDNGEANLTYTWAATSKPAGSSPYFATNGTHAAKSNGVTFDKGGAYTFTVTISDGAGTATSSVTVAVDQTLTTITVSPSAASLDLNGTRQFTAVGYDQFGLAMTSQPTIAWSKAGGVGTINASTGLYTAGATAGNAVVQAAGGGVTGTAGVTVTDAAPTVATPAAATASPVTGTTTTLTALGADDGGEANLTYTWTATTRPAGSSPSFAANGTHAAKSSLVTFDQAGSYTFSVTISDGTSNVTSSVSLVVNQTLTSVVVDPASAGVNLNQAAAFTAAAFDQFGQTLAVAPGFAWSVVAGVGSVDAAGGYVSAVAGTATVEASAGGVAGSAGVTVTDAAPTIATPAAASGPVTGTTAVLSALGADDGGENGLTYTWAATAKPLWSGPVFAGNGTNAAKSLTVTFDAAGSYTFRVSVSDASGSVTSSVTVVVDQTLTSIDVTPASAAMNLNASQQFTATAYDQFGATLATQPVIDWTTAGGVGSIDSAGLFYAGATGGTATVRATGGGVSGTAAVTVSDGSPLIATPPSATLNPGGTSATLDVLGADDGGESGLTYTWSLLSGPGGANVAFSDNGTHDARSVTATFDRAGTYTFLVTVSDGTQTATSSVGLAVGQQLTSLAVTPTSASLGIYTSRSFAAVGYDQFGASLATQPAVAWSVVSGVGTIDSAGVFAAGRTAGVGVIAATSGAASATAGVTVIDSPPTLSAAPTATLDRSGTAAGLEAIGLDADGESTLTYTWAVLAKPAGSRPAFGANGSNAAKATSVAFDRAGTYAFAVTISDGPHTVVGSVTLTVAPQVTAVRVTPDSADIVGGGEQSFRASVADQFGLAMDAPVSWSLDVGSVGTVSANGVYSVARDASGFGLVRVSAGDQSAIALVVVTPADALPPGGTSGDSPAAGRVHLEWTYDASPRRGFRIEQSADGEAWTTVTVVDPDARSVEVTGVGAGVVFYRVIALQDRSESIPSRPVTVVVQSAVLPTPVPVIPVTPPVPRPPVVPPDGSGDEVSPVAPVLPFVPPAPAGGADGSHGAITPALPAPAASSGVEPAPQDAAPVPQKPSDERPAEPTHPEPKGVESNTPPVPAASAVQPQTARASAYPAERFARGSAEEARQVADIYRAVAADPRVQAAVAEAEAAEATQQSQQQAVASAATVAAATALTGYLLWMIQGGSLMLSMLCTMPYWRWFDPMPVLESWDDNRPARKKDDSDDGDEKSESDEHELDDILGSA